MARQYLSRRGLLAVAGRIVAGSGAASLLVACGATTGGSAATTVASSTAAAASVATSAAAPATTVAQASATSAAITASAAATTISRAAVASASSAPGAKVVTLQNAARFVGGSDALKAEEALYADFTKEHPTTKVEVTPGVDPQQTLITRQAGGTPLDFVENDWGTWSGLANKKAIAELTPYFATAKIDMAIFVPEAVTNYTIQSKTYGLPVSMSVDAVAYNVDLFDANGLPHPPVDPKDTSWTMERFLEIAQKLTKGKEQFGFGGSANGYNTAGITNGTYFGMPGWDDQAQKSRYDAPEWATGSHYWLDLRDKYQAQPVGDTIKTLKGTLPDIFASGKIGMNVVYAINWKPTQMASKWALATMPYSGKGNNISGRMYPHGLHMDGTTKNTEQVWTLFQWLTKPANGGRYPIITGHAVSPLLNGGSDLAQKTRKAQWGVDPTAFLLDSYTLLPSGTGILKYSNWPNIGKELTPLYAKVDAGQTSSEDYGRQAAQIVNDNILKEA